MNQFIKPHETRPQTAETIQPNTQIKGESFASFLIQENANPETLICDNWRVSIGGKILFIEIENQGTFGEIYGLTDGTQLTENGQRFIQAVTWLQGGAFNYLREGSPGFAEIRRWQDFFESEISDFCDLRLIDNLVKCCEFDIVSLSEIQFLKLQELDIDVLSESVWEVAEEQPGYWGYRTAKEVAKRNQLYGKGKDQWTVGFNMNSFPEIGRFLSGHEFAALVFERIYYDYFCNTKEGRKTLEYFSQYASDLYEFDPAEDAKMGYDLTAYGDGPTKYQFVILKRLMLLMGLPLNGDQPIRIKGERADIGNEYGRISHPGAIAIPKYMQTYVESIPDFDNINGWWDGWEQDETVFNHDRFPTPPYPDQLKSLECLYQASKVILKRKHPDLPLIDELITASSR
jgi:hypothetical protein